MQRSVTLAEQAGNDAESAGAAGAGVAEVSLGAGVAGADASGAGVAAGVPAAGACAASCANAGIAIASVAARMMVFIQSSLQGSVPRPIVNRTTSLRQPAPVSRQYQRRNDAIPRLNPQIAGWLRRSAQTSAKTVQAPEGDTKNNRVRRIRHNRSTSR